MVFLVLVIIIAVTNNSIISPSPPSTTAGEQHQQLVDADYGQYVGNVQIKSDEIRKRCSRDTRCACSTRFFFGANWMPAIFLLLEIFLQLHLLREPGYQPRSKGDQCPLRYCESCLLLGPKGSQWIPLVLLNLLPRHQAWAPLLMLAPTTAWICSLGCGFPAPKLQVPQLPF